jgi:cytochrome P450
MALLDTAFDSLIYNFKNIGITLITLLLTLALYRLYLHPLAKFPGPPAAKVTSYWLYKLVYGGTEASTLAKLHAKYGPIVRIAPNELDIATGEALNTIYVKGGGFLKPAYYSNFNIDGYPTIFSAVDPAHRSIRAKPVLPLFATGAIREGRDVILGCVEKWVDRLQKDAIQSKETGSKVNLLTSTRSLALDAVTAYLFGKSYGGLDEDWTKEDGRLSAAYFVDYFVSVGRFFYLPPTAFAWLTLILENFDLNFGPDRYLKWKSNVAVDKYSADIVKVAVAARQLAKEDGSKEEQSETPTGTYQTRLLKAGISSDETTAQCKDLMFAGTDSTGMNLSTICFHLVQNPKKYERLRRELLDNQNADPQALPYLSGVIKEGLRLAMANPTRLPRVVGAGGLQVAGEYIPKGAVVGVGAHSLHFNASVFLNPHKFEPERWLDPTPEMIRDSVAFGVGTRQCIARNLATAELFWAVQAVVTRDVLRGARPVGREIKIIEWFNSKVVGEKIQLIWER